MQLPVKYKAVVVDDEPVARDAIEVLLQEYDSISVVGMASDGKEALKVIRAEAPDILFLDIHMPLLDGLKVAKKVQESQGPHLVFTTAYDEHALQAFELNALDYLLKPFDKKRFRKTMEKVLVALKQRHLLKFEAQIRQFQNDYAQLTQEFAVKDLRAESNFPEKITVRDSKRIVFIEVDTIQSINASGDYVEICYDGKKQLLYKSLSEIAEQLDPVHFYRIHRSHIINARQIEEIRPHQNGEFYFHLTGGHVIKSSRSFKNEVMAIIQVK